MTVNRANEVAKQIVHVYTHNLQFPFDDRFGDLEKSIATAIQSEVDAAVRAERERCAKVAENNRQDCCGRGDASRDIASAIRLSKLEKEKS